MLDEKLDKQEIPSVVGFIDLINCSIVDAPTYPGCMADAVVNAANPTLMGNSDGVDFAIHRKISDIYSCPNFLKTKIKKQIDGDWNTEDDRIRCNRGEVVVTSGFSWCNKIFHTVGVKSDAHEECKEPFLKKWLHGSCSSSCIETLCRCYRNIILAAVREQDVKCLAIPIISSGNYSMDYETAVRVAFAETYNTLLEIKNRDIECFKYLTLKKICFVIRDLRKFDLAKKVWEEYEPIFMKEHRVVFRLSRESQKEFLKEISLYDTRRGYFSIAKHLRLILVLLRSTLFCISDRVKDRRGGLDWEKRRQAIEFFAAGKIFISVFIVILLKVLGRHVGFSYIEIIVLLYLIGDTVTYLASLIILADIQRPSANVIRSMVMLSLNYLEVSLDISVITYIKYYGVLRFRDALAFGLSGVSFELPEVFMGALMNWSHHMLLYLNQGTKFFFLTLAFGYFANHLIQRKYR